MMILEMTAKEHSAYLLPAALSDSDRLRESGKNIAYGRRCWNGFAKYIFTLELETESDAGAWDSDRKTRLTNLFKFWVGLHASQTIVDGYPWGETGFLDLQWGRLCRLEQANARASKEEVQKILDGPGQSV